MTTLYMTRKQSSILDTLKQVNSDGSFLDLDQLLERLPYKTTKESLQFSLRTLIKHGLVHKHPSEIRRNRHRRILSLTALGYKRLGFCDGR